ncbi:hypothetical protein GCM10011611_23070 [Aliidongia dinghuensis]|uniref:Cytochrome c n=1 Tax=Aliidongia dinghuensis TaxID=1867774 RepID=A0A8J2YTI3_9PROT|nr:cytochrome c [Aliidongia dinghuensis]GGF16686.1 hypothetical protein GCM10011611_23070 [Aliidongia dinghuensis]
MPKRPLPLFLGLAAFGLSLGLAWAAAEVPAVVAERQATMKGFANKVKLIKSFADGEDNGADALQAARDILATASHLPELFPAGTSLADLPGVKTHAKPEIWADNERFRATAVRLATQAQALAAAIERGDRPGTATELGAIGRVGCGACHEAFRAPLE